MSRSLHANNRLLWSIINAPFLLATPRTLPIRLQTLRLFATSSRPRSDGLAGSTFSFGSDADTIIADLAQGKPAESAQESKPRRRGRPKATATQTGENGEEQPSPAPGRAKGRRKSSPDVDDDDAQPQPPPHTHSLINESLFEEARHQHFDQSGSPPTPPAFKGDRRARKKQMSRWLFQNKKAIEKAREIRRKARKTARQEARRMERMAARAAGESLEPESHEGKEEEDVIALQEEQTGDSSLVLQQTAVVKTEEGVVATDEQKIGAATESEHQPDPSSEAHEEEILRPIQSTTTTTSRPDKVQPRVSRRETNKSSTTSKRTERSRPTSAPSPPRPQRNATKLPRSKTQPTTNGGDKRTSRAVAGTPPPPTHPDGPETPALPTWAVQKSALTSKFSASGGWNPRRKLSPDAILGIKQLHASNPLTYSTPVLAEQFKISPEAIRRILKSKWMEKAGADKVQERRKRWAKRHDAIWDQKVQLGLRPPRERGRGRRVLDASEGAEEVEGGLWRERVLKDARSE